ncbi:MAG: hypothetical protein ACPKPY_09615 [Nitrososphaeraceae archaeon]
MVDYDLDCGCKFTCSYRIPNSGESHLEFYPDTKILVSQICLKHKNILVDELKESLQDNFNKQLKKIERFENYIKEK